MRGALLVTHNGDAWARAEGSAAEVDVSGCVVPYVRGMGYARAPIDENWLVNLDVIVPAALGTFATDASPGAAFAGNAYETELMWENDTIVGVRVTIEHTIHEDTVAAYLEQRSGSLAKLLWPTLGAVWSCVDGSGWARASMLDLDIAEGSLSHKLMGGWRLAAVLKATLPVGEAGLLLAAGSTSTSLRSLWHVARALEEWLFGAGPPEVPASTRTPAIAAYILGLTSSAYPASWVSLVPGFAEKVVTLITRESGGTLLSVLESELERVELSHFSSAVAGTTQMADMLRQADQWSAAPVDRVSELVNMFRSKLADKAQVAPPAVQAAPRVVGASPFGSFGTSRLQRQRDSSAPGPGLVGGMFGAPAAGASLVGLLGKPTPSPALLGAASTHSSDILPLRQPGVWPPPHTPSLLRPPPPPPGGPPLGDVARASPGRRAGVPGGMPPPPPLAATHVSSAASAEAFAAVVASTLHPSQLARVALAVGFIAPSGVVTPRDVIGMLGRGNHELAVRLFASKGWGDRGDVDEMAHLQGGFDTDTTAIAALDDLGRTLDEFLNLGGQLPVGAPATREVALLRIASIQLEMKELRKRAAEMDAAPTAAATAAASHTTHTLYHQPPPPPPPGPPGPVKPPEGSMLPVSLTASTDVLVRAAACERDVITPLTQLPYVMARWAENDRLEAMDTLTGASALTGMSEPAGQAAWAFLFCSGACTKKLQYGISSVVHNFHDRLRVWVDVTAVEYLGGIASRAAGGLVLRGAIRDCVSHFALKAVPLIQVYAAHPSTNVASAVHIPSHEGLLGDSANAKDILSGVKNFESAVLHEVWGGPGQVSMLPRADWPSQGAFGLTGLVVACSAAGLGPKQTLEVLDKTFEEIRDEAAERRRTRGATVVNVTLIVARNKMVRVTETSSREQSMAAGAEGARLALQQMGAPTLLTLSSRHQLADQDRARSPSAFSYTSDGQGQTAQQRWRDTASPSALRPLAKRGRERERDRDTSRSRSPSRGSEGGGLRDRSRDSMPANRQRLAAGTPEADREVRLLGMQSPARSDDARQPPPRVPEREASADRDRASRSRSPARERDAGAGRKGEPPPPSPSSLSVEPIAHRAALARAFRQRCQALGIPHTCPFVACAGTCSNPACDDCKNAARYDPRKHSQVVDELKRRADVAFSFRWRDTG